MPGEGARRGTGVPPHLIGLIAELRSAGQVGNLSPQIARAGYIGLDRPMAKLTSQDRRKQILKQRRAEAQREAGRDEVWSLCARARDANRAGDAPAADRLLKRALVLDPDQAEALSLLAQIHESAGHHAE